MNAILFLKKEHDKVRRTFLAISSESHRFSTKKEMFSLLCQDLMRHEIMEEEVWYPHFRNNKQLEKTLKHLITEEKNSIKTIKEFEKIKSQDEWEEKFLQFKHDVEHHAEEEETKLFPYVEKILDKNELEIIGKAMREFKKGFNKKLAA